MDSQTLKMIPILKLEPPRRTSRFVGNVVSVVLQACILLALASPSLYGDTALVEGNVIRILTLNPEDSQDSVCRAELSIMLTETGLDCDDRWVTFSCSAEEEVDESAEAGTGEIENRVHRMFKSFQTAMKMDKLVELLITDEKQDGDFCHASRIIIQNSSYIDEDSDNDGVDDLDDELPQDPTETVDTDNDGVGNNADDDDDNDGVEDSVDAFPLDPGESVDTDGDGIGNKEDTDDDNDGVEDAVDAFPLDPGESVDTDGDGIGDNKDQDLDGDGVLNDEDIEPQNPHKSNLISYKFIGEGRDDFAGSSVTGVKDFNGDGVDEILIGAPQHIFYKPQPDLVDIATSMKKQVGAAYLISINDLATLDAADGKKDRQINLALVHTGVNSWKLACGPDSRNFHARGYAYHCAEAVSSGDINNDGTPELMITSAHDSTVFIVSNKNLEAADEADGIKDHIVFLPAIADGVNSWALSGQEGAIQNNPRIVFKEGTHETPAMLLIGSPSLRVDRLMGIYGTTYYVPMGSLGILDAVDGAIDGRLSLPDVVGEASVKAIVARASTSVSGVGRRLAFASNLNGNATDYLVISELRDGSAHILSISQLDAADKLDGELDGIVELHKDYQLDDSWRIAGSWRYMIASGVDFTNDGVSELGFGNFGSRVTYLVSGLNLSTLDRQDGEQDGQISRQNILSATDRWRIEGIKSNAMTMCHDIGSVGSPGLLIGDYGLHGLYGDRTSAFLVSADTLIALETHERNISVGSRLSPAQRWLIAPKLRDRAGSSLACIRDVDDDGLSEILIGAKGDTSNGEHAGAVYLVMSSDFEALDSLSTEANGELLLGDIVGDTDQDGIRNIFDQDDDNDGVSDSLDLFQLDGNDWIDSDRDGFGDNTDVFPTDRSEWLDTDLDGIGDEADEDDDGDGIADSADEFPLDTDNDSIPNTEDSDDDNDGVADTEDHFPIDPDESLDNDSDGIGDNADLDDDNDSVEDTEDAFPFNALETTDSDNDGYGDNSDAFPTDPNEWLDSDEDGIGNVADRDDDNDSVADTEDAFPLDATESTDSDNDGYGDNSDVFPLDPNEWLDSDEDGIGNVADRDDDNDSVADTEDAFPLDATESTDSDNDGYGDNSDVFPLDPNEWLDSDEDGIGNVADLDDDNDSVADTEDAFPLDATESTDSDNDGYGDNSDVFPLDPNEWLDSDEDGIGNVADLDDDNDSVADTEDAFPLDATESTDSDNDGYGDNSDVFPLDPNEWLDSDEDGIGNVADLDDDNDSVADTEDAFPLDATESTDSDNDGYGDNSDVFPLDPNEWEDSDGDGIGNIADIDDDNDLVLDVEDIFPFNVLEWADSDLDGYGDNNDAFPLDPLEWLDSDGDRIGDNADLIDNTSVDESRNATIASINVYQGPLVKRIQSDADDLGGSVWVVDDFLKLVVGRRTIVEVQVLDNSSLPPDASLTLESTNSSVEVYPVTPLNTTKLSDTSWETFMLFDLEQGALKAHSQIKIRLDPSNELTESSKRDNINISLLTDRNSAKVETVKIQLLPISRNKDIIPDSIDIDEYMAPAYTYFPIESYSGLVGETLVYEQEEWHRREAALLVLHHWNKIGGSDDIFMGVFKYPFDGSPCGFVFHSYPVGVTAEPGNGCPENIFAHEFGHILNLLHAPGCGTANPDPNFPYTTGVGPYKGWSFHENTFIDPSKRFDIMSYCHPNFITHYNYKNVLTNRTQSTEVTTSLEISSPLLATPQVAQSAGAGAVYVESIPNSFALTGRVDELGNWYLNAAEASSAPPREDKGGDFILSLHDINGEILYQEPVRLGQLGNSPTQGWAARVPILKRRIETVKVTDHIGIVVYQTNLDHKQSWLNKVTKEVNRE